MKRASRIAASVMGGVVALLAAALRGEEPEKNAEAIQAPWLRQLQKDDARRVAELDKKVTELWSAGRFLQAIDPSREIYEIRRKALGNTHWETVNAEHFYRTCKKISARPAKEQAEVVSAVRLNQNASEALGQSRYAEAERMFRKELDINLRLLGDRDPLTAVSYHSVAACLHLQGKYDEAEIPIRRALAILQKVLGEGHPDTGKAYDDLATLLHSLGRYVEADKYYRKAFVILQAGVGDTHFLIAAGYNNVAFNLNSQGRYADALPLFEKALVIKRKELGDGNGKLGTVYGNIAFTLMMQGKYADAQPIYETAVTLDIKEIGESSAGIASTYENIASNLRSLRKYEEAERYLRKALDITVRATGETHPDAARQYIALAVFLDTQGKHAEAETLLKKVFTICRERLGEDHPLRARAYNAIAYNRSVQGDHKEAEKGFRDGLAIRRKRLGDEHPFTAQSYRWVASTLSAQGKYQEAEGLWNSASKSFTKARLHIAGTGLERAEITSEWSPLPFLAAVLGRNGKPDEAWQRFEESLARGTWDDLTARLHRPQAERDKQSQIAARIDRLSKLIEKISVAKPTPEQTKQRDELLSQLRQAYDELAAFTQQLEKKYGPVAGQVFPRAQIQAELPAEAAFVAWLDIPGQPKAKDPNGEHWAILLRSAGSPVWVRLHGSGDKNAWTDADTKLPARLRAALQKSSSEWQPLAERLRKQRLDPLAQHLKGVRRLIVLPSTALAGLPVEVIANGYTVSYAHSGTMFAHLRRPTHTGTGLLVLADPIFDIPTLAEKPQPLLRGGDGNWSRLPGTRIEAASLQRLFGTDLSQVLLDSNASEQRLDEMAKSGELGKYRYLHLATHGEVNDDFPLRSAVILSRDRLPDDKQRTELLLSGQPIPDGRLEADEALRRWNLHADLVTLSACQTALGKYERGEGFVGFAQALILCGTRSVCLSLWRVDDAATALLMERFYRNLLGKRDGLKAPMTKAAALAEAKNWLRTLPREEAVKRAASLSNGVDRGKRKALPPTEPTPAAAEKSDCPYAHPYYWAAFVLVGHAD